MKIENWEQNIKAYLMKFLLAILNLSWIELEFLLIQMMGMLLMVAMMMDRDDVQHKILQRFNCY